jgi:hypothetical protein
MHGFVWRHLQYAVTGGIAAVVDACGFVLLVKVKLSIVVASGLSFCIADRVNYNMTNRFVLNREATLRRIAPFMTTAFRSIGILRPPIGPRCFWEHDEAPSCEIQHQTDRRRTDLSQPGRATE